MLIESFSFLKYKIGVGKPYFLGQIQDVELLKLEISECDLTNKKASSEILAIKQGVIVGTWDIEGNPIGNPNKGRLQLAYKKSKLYRRTDTFTAFMIKSADQLGELKAFLGSSFRVNYEENTQMLSVRLMKNFNILSKTEVPLRGNGFAFVKNAISGDFIASMSEAMFKRNYKELNPAEA